MVTALRETREESDLLESDLKIFKESKQELNYLVKNRPKLVIYWLAELINPAAQVKLSDEHIDYKWLVLEDACKYGKYTDMQNLLKFYDDFIKKELKN